MSTVALRGIISYDNDAKEWSWRGRWVFGDSLPRNINDGAKDTSQAFLYQWQDATSPSKVLVPSLNVKILGNEDGTEAQTTTEASEDTPLKQSLKEPASTQGVDPVTPKSTLDPKTEGTRSNESFQSPTENITPKTKDEDGTRQSEITNRDVGIEPPKKIDTTNEPNEPVTKESSVATNPTLDGDTQASNSSSLKKEDTSTTTVPSTPKVEKPKISFEALMPSFVEASQRYGKDKLCPPSGSWKGHFENLIPGKKGRNKSQQQPPKIQKIDETFCLFLNAKPCFAPPIEQSLPESSSAHKANDSMDNTLFAFESTTKDHIPTSSEQLVQVRGCGENQFGTFEIMGYLDLATMVMEIQRQYVVTEITPVTPRPVRSRSSASNATAASERPHSTRKRKATWKRASYDTEDDRRRKRPGILPEPGPRKSPTSVSSKVPGVSTNIPLSQPSKVTKSRLVLPTQSNTNQRKQPLVEGNLRSKKRSPGKAVAPVSTKTGSTHIRLPSVGDPKKARWRAAHFLYYHRPEEKAPQTQSNPSSQPPPQGGTSNSNATAAPPPKPKYVIYEGEMVDSKREGRGICLYSDGTMYEGEWKRNKEHGYGKLMTSDRKITIYEGEWEKGRMQGKGTYYYTHSQSSDETVGKSKYIGEFRENLRNGIGQYFLEDGSIYDGQWRDGVMNGHGLFTWPDKSFYDGIWKDGKRNGQGLLKKADGFVYDGQWVNNTMEGRGSAIYPNGQRYEGSFSNGRREGRGTIIFTNGAVYEGRFRDDAVDGQGTMKMSQTIIVPNQTSSMDDGREGLPRKQDFMIPISFQSDMTRILTKTGFM